MARIQTAQITTLGKLAAARGDLGPAHSHATDNQMAIATGIVSDPASFSSELEDCVICVEDRLGPDGSRMHAARLAGGAVCAALMHHLLYGGDKLSDNMAELKRLRITTVCHGGRCGALNLAPTLIPQRLSSVDADGYKLVEALGYQAAPAQRQRIAKWASSLPSGFVVPDEVLQSAAVSEEIVGMHNAVAAAVSMADGYSFVAGHELSEQTGGLLAFAFDPWVAERLAGKLAVSREDTEAATLLALVFTAEVLLELGGKDLLVSIVG